MVGLSVVVAVPRRRDRGRAGTVGRCRLVPCSRKKSRPGTRGHSRATTPPGSRTQTRQSPAGHGQSQCCAPPGPCASSAPRSQDASPHTDRAGAGVPEASGTARSRH